MDTIPTTPSLIATTPNLALRCASIVLVFFRSVARAIGTLFVIGLSLLPLAALLVALPAVSPNEAVLTESVRPVKSWWRRTARRVLAFVAGIVVLIALFAFSIEVTSRLPLPTGGQLSTLAKKVLGFAATDFMPDDENPNDVEPLKGLLARQSEIRKTIGRCSGNKQAMPDAEAQLAKVNTELADWAEAQNKEWIVPAKMLDARRALRANPATDPGKLARLEAEIANQAVANIGKWAPPQDLLLRLVLLKMSISKPNADETLRAESTEELRLVAAELADRTPKVPKLRVMLDPDLSPILAKPIWTLLPPTLVNQWPYVFLIMYASDLALLLLIGKVPLAYNLRYLWVRRRDTFLTAVVFTVVVALVVVLLAFVNGMYKLNEGTGVPGNVLVLSEGSTDEIFSNLGRSDIDGIEKETVSEDAQSRPMPTVGVQRIVRGPDGKALIGSDDKPVLLPDDASQTVRDKSLYMTSSEIYMVMNQPVPTKPGEHARRRLLQVRALDECRIAAAVHNISLYPGGKWFTAPAIEKDGKAYLTCCIGEGAAGTLGEDVGKRRLEPGDTFNLGDENWIVLGIMNTQGTTYGSEIWTTTTNTVVVGTGRGSKYTTLVMRMARNNETASRAMATYLQDRYTQVKLKAFCEPDYYKDLTKSNESFLVCIVIVAVVMAIGGVFGVMNTMFASIAARIKEVGVMRILGFKRWQILIAFMLESLMIAFVGGFLGCLLGSLFDGLEASSQLQGGAGGGKSVVLQLVVDFQILAAGMLFTLVLGRLGGLVPALSAMRMEILDSLR
jgi:putative ABC transport system permease protein